MQVKAMQMNMGATEKQTNKKLGGGGSIVF